MTELSNKKEETMFKAGDVIEVTLSIDLEIPDEDFENRKVDLDNYSGRFIIDYTLPENIICSSCSIDAEPGFGSIFDYDIKRYIEEYLSNDISEIDKYEIFDVDNSSFEYQKAKIRVKSLK